MTQVEFAQFGVRCLQLKIDDVTLVPGSDI